MVHFSSHDQYLLNNSVPGADSFKETEKRNYSGGAAYVWAQPLIETADLR
jgi:hypothetical protein